jgi:hypothetical protein
MSSVVAQWPVRMIAAPAIASKAPKTFSPGAMITRSLLRGQLASIAPSALLLPVDDAEYQLEVLSDARSPAALQLLGYASAAQRTAGVRRLVPHALLRLLQPDGLALGVGAPHPLRDRVRLFARERKNVAQGRIRCAGPSVPAVPPAASTPSPNRHQPEP